MSAPRNGRLVCRVVDAIWNRGDLDLADELFARDYVNHDGPIPDLLGPEAIKISVALYRLAFPRLHITVEELNTHEDTVVLRWTASSGCTDGDDGSTLATSQRLLTGVTRSRLADGKIKESWTEWDQVRV